MTTNTEYLGDGVYVIEENGMVKLMANDPETPSDTIYLEPDVFISLVKWAQRKGFPVAQQKKPNV